MYQFTRMATARVLEQLAGAPEAVRRDFFALQAQLCQNPYPPDGPEVENSPIKALKESGFPNSFTAPFDDGFLSYQVKADQPLIEPLGIVWA